MACSRLLLPTTDSGPNFELCEPILSRNKLDRYIYKKLLYRTLFADFELNISVCFWLLPNYFFWLTRMMSLIFIVCDYDDEVVKKPLFFSWIGSEREPSDFSKTKFFCLKKINSKIFKFLWKNFFSSISHRKVTFIILRNKKTWRGSRYFWEEI